MNLIPEIELYSDGGADPNPDRGGYGVILSYKGRRKEFSKGYKLTTNNRMELLGIIAGFEKLKQESIVHVFTDSRYVIDGIEKGWAAKWKANNWYRNKKEKAINIDLWDRLLELIEKHEVKFNWVKGHSGHPINERCDFLAASALKSDNLIDDIGYLEQLEREENTDDKPVSYPGNKIKAEGDLCRKCSTPLIKKIPKRKKLKPNQTYYFEYYLICPNCKTTYNVEAAKKEIDLNENPTLF